MIDKQFIKNFNKVCNTINSCKTNEQLDNAYEWGANYVFNGLYDKEFKDMRAQCHDMLYESFLDYLSDVYNEKKKELRKFICE